MKEKTKILKEWKLRLNKSQIGHYMASEKCSRYYAFFGISIVILSSLLTGLLFLDYYKLEHSGYRLMLKLISIFIAIFSGIQALFRYGEKSEIHRSKATKYGALKRKIEVFLSKEDQEDIDGFLNDLQKDWNYIAEVSPVTPKKIRAKIKEIIKEEKEEKEEIIN